MPKILRSAEAISRAIQVLTDFASEQLKTLLETKHLYQRVSIEPVEGIEALDSEIEFSGDASQFTAFVNEKLPSLTLLPSTGRLYAPSRGGGDLETANVPCLLIDNVKMFCPGCKEREAFAPAFFRDMDNEIANISGRWGGVTRGEKTGGSPIEQHFVIAYLCQRCSLELVTVLVTRRGWYLTLEGRSPLEVVDTPKYIPKKERHLFAESSVAMHAGRVLAALFFLRIFIEQFARRQTFTVDVRASGEDIMERYGKTLPEERRNVLPSLKVCYEKLSEAIHAARPDEELLEKMRAQIDQHFALRDIFKIPDAPKPDSSS